MIKTLIKFLPTNVKISDADIRLVEKIANTYGVEAYADVDYGVNPISGVTLNVNPTVAALVEFIHTAYFNYSRSANYRMTYNNKLVAIGVFDRVKYLVLKLDRNAYSNLID
jgi:hypothetical protein